MILVLTSLLCSTPCWRSMCVSWNHECSSTFAGCNKITLFLFFLSQESVEALRSKGQGTQFRSRCHFHSMPMFSSTRKCYFLFWQIALVHLQNNTKKKYMKYLIRESSIKYNLEKTKRRKNVQLGLFMWTAWSQNNYQGSFPNDIGLG